MSSIFFFFFSRSAWLEVYQFCLQRTSFWCWVFSVFLFVFYLLISFFFFKILFGFRREGREKERERNSNVSTFVRDTWISCLSHAPNWGPGLQPRHVPWPGIKLITFQFAGQSSIHWATPARVPFFIIFFILLILDLVCSF